MNETLKHLQKQQYEKAVKRSISMPAIMLDRAMAKTRQRGFTAFSDYIQDLIRKDNAEYTVNL